MARRGAWLEYDGIGGGDADERYIQHIRRALDAGFVGQVMLGVDRGWYSHGQPVAAHQTVHLPQRDLPASPARCRRE